VLSLFPLALGLHGANSQCCRMDAPGKALVAKYEDAAEKVERLKRLVSQAKAQQGFMHK